MQTPVRRTSSALLLAGFLGGGLLTTGLPGHAQNPADPAPAAAPAGARGQATAPAPSPAPTTDPAAKPAPTNPAPNGSGTGPALDYLYNRKPQDGSAAKQASEISRRMDDKAKAAEALGLGKPQGAQDQAKFEKYLGTAEVSPADLKAYATILNQV